MEKFYSKVLIDDIENEKEGIDFDYTKKEGIVLQKLLKEINEFAGTDFHYLAELNAFDIEGAGVIGIKYMEQFDSETIRSILIEKAVSDRIKDCDKMLLQSYLHFKESEYYIGEENMPSPAHIYVQYDNSFRRLKPKRLKKELLKLAYDPRDASYLPLTMKMLASWKLLEMKEVLITYLDSEKISAQSVGLKEGENNRYPSLERIRRDLKFIAIAGLKYYPSKETEILIKPYLDDSDKDIREAAKKTWKVLNK